MKRLCVILSAFTLAVTNPAFATEASEQGKIDSASALVEMLQFERTLDGMFDSLKSMFAQNVIAAMERDDPSGQSTRFFNAIRGGRERFSQILGEEFLRAMREQYPEFKKTAAKEYAAQFSEGELQTIVSFFNTGAGAKWLSNSEKIQESMGQWGEKAGMKAGASAVATAMERVEHEQTNKGNSE